MCLHSLQLEGDDFTPAESRIQQHTVFTQILPRSWKWSGERQKGRQSCGAARGAPQPPRLQAAGPDRCLSLGLLFRLQTQPIRPPRRVQAQLQRRPNRQSARSPFPAPRPSMASPPDPSKTPPPSGLPPRARQTHPTQNRDGHTQRCCSIGSRQSGMAACRRQLHFAGREIQNSPGRIQSPGRGCGPQEQRGHVHWGPSIRAGMKFQPAVGEGWVGRNCEAQ